MSRIDEIKCRLMSITPGPWAIYNEPLNAHIRTKDGKVIALPPHGNSPNRGNAELIANAPEDLAFLLEELAASACLKCGTSNAQWQDYKDRGAQNRRLTSQRDEARRQAAFYEDTLRLIAAGEGGWAEAARACLTLEGERLPAEAWICYVCGIRHEGPDPCTHPDGLEAT